MASACKINVLAKNGKKSRLFSDLLSHTGNRELSKQLWSIAQEDSLMEQFDGLERDSNGEVTYDSFTKAVNISDLLDRQHQINNEAMTLGISDKNGAPLFFDRISTALDRAILFNEGKNDFVSEVKIDGKPFVQIREKTLLDSTTNNELKFKRDLNNRLLAILNDMGFDITFMEDPKTEGVFNPLLAETNANNLKTVIQIAKGERGEDAFPEEFSHLIIAGLKNNTMIDRLKSFTTTEIVREVLGPQYEQYREEYKDSNTLEADLQEEAMGKMLAEAIIYGTEKSPLLQRVWNRAKQMFATGSAEYIDDLVNGLKSNLESVVEVINKPEELKSIIDSSLILSNRSLKKLSLEVKKLKDIAVEGERLIAKRLQLYKLDNEWDDMKRTRKNEDMEEINELRTLIANDQCVVSCCNILRDALRQIERLNNDTKRLSEFQDTDNPSLRELASVAKQLNEIKRFNEAYEPLINTLAALDVLVASGQMEQIDKQYVDQIKSMAEEVRKFQNEVSKSQEHLRYRIIKNWIGLTYGESKLKSFGSNPEEAQSLELICQKADRDITFLGKNISSFADSGNPLLNVLHAILAKQQAQRNTIINEYYAFLQAANAKLAKAGHTSEYMFERDKDGVATGRFVSPYDFEKYEAAKNAYIEELNKNHSLDEREFLTKIRVWERDNQKWYEVDPDSGRKELLPDLEKYRKDDFQKGWDQAMVDYYNDIIDYKAKLDTMLPISVQSVFHAPQVDKSTVELLDVRDPKGTLDRLWKKIKDHYVGTNDNVRSGVNPDQLSNSVGDFDVSYSDKEYEYTKSSILDYSGRPIRRVPIYYTKDLDDMSLLSTDATKAMMSYACMAVNYQEMNKIADLALLLKDHVKETYKVTMRKAGNKIYEAIPVLNKLYVEPYEVVGGESNIYTALNDFLEANMFGGAHEDMPVLKNGLKTHAVFEDFRSYVSKNALGFNLFSGLSNVTMGEAQMLSEGFGGYHFNMKDLMWAHKEYTKLMKDFVAEAGSSHKTNKLDLLMNAFNADEEFFRSIQEDIYNKKAFMRVMGKANCLFLQTAGEHMMHAVGMLAILHHIQTYRMNGNNQRENSNLYDSLEVKDYNGANLLVIKDGTKIDPNDKNNKDKNWYKNLTANRDGSYSVDEDNMSNMNTLMSDLSVYINRVNSGLHGGYGQLEKGTGNRKWYWRLLMQFRQWMPGTYNELYHKEYYDAIYGLNRSGAFNVTWKFIKKLALDVKRGEIALALNWEQLNNYERAQCKKAFFTSGMFIVMSGLAMLARGLSDKDRPWAEKMLRYQIERLRLETGALVPNITMLENFNQILQSPMAGIDGVNNILNALKFWQAADEIESGRYEGWSVWERNLFRAIPYHNIVKAMDMVDDNYMFRMFDSK